MKSSDKIKAVIIDDESYSRELIFNIIEHNFPSFIIETADNVLNGLKTINTLNPDIVFLDIDMPDGTGFDLLKNIVDYNFKVIFITAHEEHAVKAIKFSALDYILKPVNSLELVDAVKQAIEVIKTENEGVKIETLLDNISKISSADKRMILNTSDNMYIVDINDIIRCKSDNNYTTFYLKNNKKITMSKTLKEYENLLPDTVFLRIHRSHIININCIEKISKKKSGIIFMEDMSEIPVSPNKKELLLKMLRG